MQKRVKGRKFSRVKKVRKAFLGSLMRALFLSEKITTTEARAKEISRLAEKAITKAKGGTLAARKELIGMFDRAIAKKLAETIAPRYKERPGGYTRIVKLVPRKSDSARRAIIELLP